MNGYQSRIHDTEGVKQNPIESMNNAINFENRVNINTQFRS